MVVHVARRTGTAVVRNVWRRTVADAVQATSVAHTVVVRFAFSLVTTELRTAPRYVSVWTFAVVAVVIASAFLVHTDSAWSARIAIAFVDVHARLVRIASEAGQTATLVAALRVHAFGVLRGADVLQSTFVDVRTAGRQVCVSGVVLFTLTRETADAIDADGVRSARVQ